MDWSWVDFSAGWVLAWLLSKAVMLLPDRGFEVLDMRKLGPRWRAEVRWKNGKTKSYIGWGTCWSSSDGFETSKHLNNALNFRYLEETNGHG